MGIHESSIKKTQDSKNSALEYDFFFDHLGRKYGISAKRTLRERYKQFSKSENIDAAVLIHISLGLDLTRAKMETIRKNDVYIFVANEIYEKEEYMQKRDGVFPVSEFNLATLERLM